MSRSEVLVFGDLALDIRGHDSQSGPYAVGHTFVRGENVAVNLDVSTAVGGTAVNFARALESARTSAPRIVGAVGVDDVGSVVLDGLKSSGISVSLIQSVEAAATSVIYSAYFANGQRLLLQPRESANLAVSMTWLSRQRAFDKVTLSHVAFVWISGYCLVHESPRRRAIVRMCAAARAHGVPIFVDLVPHAFSAAVGNFGILAQLLGPVTGIVCERDTAVEMGLVDISASVQDAAAQIASELGLSVIVQDLVSQRTYGQGVASPLEGVQYMERAFVLADLPGLGDRMAVDALQKLEILPAAAESV